MHSLPIRLSCFTLVLLVLTGCDLAHKTQSIIRHQSSVTIVAEDGRKLKVTPYAEGIVRLQSARVDEAFYPNDHYEMVVTHKQGKPLNVKETETQVVLSNEKLRLEVELETLRARFFINGKAQPVLSEKQPVSWSDSLIQASFEQDPDEHFTGLGHGFYAREKSLDLQGKVIERNYGAKPIEQAPLIVPFYMSSKGYGIFLNSSFSNRFNFGKDQQYSFAIDDGGFSGQMDYFFIAGPELTKVLDQYTQLTGRPRLPQKAMFGLQLSDKGHDHTSATPSDMAWWQQKISAHRQAGLPLDHVVNDNRWRAAGGKRCQSKLAWDKERYPDPAAYNQWLQENGLVVTLDFNRCIAQYSEGWQPSFNLPETGEIEFPASAPDLTNPAFRAWFWQVFYQQALKPSQQYPGDALWIDEFDEQGHAPKDMILNNGRSSGEMRNYWFFLIAKALVEQGWDQSNIDKRPFVWVRGMTAGAQRYATLWSGDIYPNYEDMADQIRGMQLAGLSGFPYWGHDAGGFYDWDRGLGPDEKLYQRWAMAFGSFAPIWKPHGMGQSRWPLDRSAESQHTAHKFARLRYKLMPYLYSAAHQAAHTGMPIARAMLLDYQSEANAWQYDLQYMWGENMLVAPLTQDTGEKEVWLPPSLWYDYFTDKALSGDSVISVSPDIGDLPVFVKAGAILPLREFALSTAFIDKSKLELVVYAGADGTFELVEDDDVTEQYRKQKQMQITPIGYSDTDKVLTIAAAKGTYQGAPQARDIKVSFVGMLNLTTAKVNGQPVRLLEKEQRFVVELHKVAIDTEIKIQLF